MSYFCLEVCLEVENRAGREGLCLKWSLWRSSPFCGQKGDVYVPELGNSQGIGERIEFYVGWVSILTCRVLVPPHFLPHEYRNTKGNVPVPGPAPAPAPPISGGF